MVSALIVVIEKESPVNSLDTLWKLFARELASELDGVNASANAPQNELLEEVPFERLKKALDEYVDHRIGIIINNSTWNGAQWIQSDGRFHFECEDSNECCNGEFDSFEEAWEFMVANAPVRVVP